MWSNIIAERDKQLKEYLKKKQIQNKIKNWWENDELYRMQNSRRS